MTTILLLYLVFSICAVIESWKLTWMTQLLVATIFILVISLQYLHCHRIMEVDLDNLALGDNNFHFHFWCSVFVPS